MDRVKFKKGFIVQSFDNRGAALITVLLLATIMGVVLTASYILVKAQLAQANRLGLRLVAEKLNSSAAEIMTRLLDSHDITLDEYMIGAGYAQTFVDGGHLGANITVTTGTASVPSYVTLNFCQDLSNNSDTQCYHTPSSAVLTPSTKVVIGSGKACGGGRCNLAIHVETTLLDVFRPNKAFKFTDEFVIGPFRE